MNNILPHPLTHLNPLSQHTSSRWLTPETFSTPLICHCTMCIQYLVCNKLRVYYYLLMVSIGNPKKFLGPQNVCPLKGSIHKCQNVNLVNTYLGYYIN